MYDSTDKGKAFNSSPVEEEKTDTSAALIASSDEAAAGPRNDEEFLTYILKPSKSRFRHLAHLNSHLNFANTFLICLL